MRLYWWQRGPLITCGYLRAFPACLLDNLQHTQRVHRMMLRRRTGWAWLFHGTVEGGWVCRWHDRAVDHAITRKWDLK